jgi:hypothetical protein
MRTTDPVCPEWAPGIHPNCVVKACPVWADGVFPNCSFNYTKPGLSCSLPWGGTIQHGGTVTAWLGSSVAYDEQCSSQVRTCQNGILSGSYVNRSCTQRPAANCSTPWGGLVAHGSSVFAYANSSVPAGGSCSGQTRTCTNGFLSGSGSYATCTVAGFVTVTCTSEINATRSITAYYDGQDPLTGRAPSGLGTWVVFANGTALNCDDADYYPAHQNISATNAPEHSRICRQYGGSGAGTYLHSCYYTR